MGKDLIISANRHETKVAIMEDEQLVEIFFQRADEYSLVGSIHKGRVTRVLPGMQSAFVDIGLDRDAFLYVSDFFEESDEYEQLGGDEAKAVPHERPVEVPVVGEAEPEGRDRNRRGRRSRRRRSKGRGFPESKYAAAEAEVKEKEEPPKAVDESDKPEVREPREDRETRELRETRETRETRRPREVRAAREPAEEFEDPESEEFLLLPGESLAKYSRNTRVDEAQPAENADAETAESEHDSGVSDAADSAADASPEPAESAEEPDAAGEEEVGTSTESRLERTSTPEPEESADDRDVEETSGAAPEAEGVAKDQSEADENEQEPESKPSVEGASESETETAVARESEPMATERKSIDPNPGEEEPPQAGSGVSEEPESESNPAGAGSSETKSLRSSRGRRGGRRGRSRRAESEDDDIKAMILGQLDDTLKAELAAESEKENAEEDSKSAERGSSGEETFEAGADDDDPKTKASAAVRDQGQRYEQRAPRRGRRRGRSGRGENRVAGNSSDDETSDSAPEEAAPSGPVEDEAVAVDDSESQPSEQRGKADKGPLPLISDLLNEGQEILVQVAKEPMGQKGARITSHIALPGRYVVYMPTLDHLGVSRKIGSDKERQRLRRCLQNNRDGIPGGFIMRTAGEGKTEEEIAVDMRYLFNLWVDIRQKAEKRRAPALLHHDLRVVERVLRDQMTDDFTAIWVDQEDAYESIVRFLERFQPAVVKRVRLYTRSAPIFDAFNITQELEKAIRPKVWLKSGGYIVINQTEALVAIDINTGKYIGRSNRLEDTIVKTNIEAVKEIARQMRLRDLGGIIVVDFIDMEERKNRHKVMQALEAAMRTDRAPSKILQFNDFGLVAITRRRVKQSLERTLCMPCPYCEGAAYVKSVETVIGEILTEAHKLAPALESEDVVLRVHPDVAQTLKNSKNHYLEELEEILNRPVLVTADGLLHHEKFDLA